MYYASDDLRVNVFALLFDIAWPVVAMVAAAVCGWLLIGVVRRLLC
jgi:hypothetical protein